MDDCSDFHKLFLYKIDTSTTFIFIYTYVHMYICGCHRLITTLDSSDSRLVHWWIKNTSFPDVISLTKANAYMISDISQLGLGFLWERTAKGTAGYLQSMHLNSLVSALLLVIPSIVCCIILSRECSQPRQNIGNINK